MRQSGSADAPTQLVLEALAAGAARHPEPLDERSGAWASRDESASRGVAGAFRHHADDLRVADLAGVAC
jgi:hypothetical protein